MVELGKIIVSSILFFQSVESVLCEIYSQYCIDEISCYVKGYRVCDRPMQRNREYHSYQLYSIVLFIMLLLMKYFRVDNLLCYSP